MFPDCLSLKLIFNLSYARKTLYILHPNRENCAILMCLLEHPEKLHVTGSLNGEMASGKSELPRLSWIKSPLGKY